MKQNFLLYLKQMKNINQYHMDVNGLFIVSAFYQAV